jgi:replicative DNA helicase Mcm
MRAGAQVSVQDAQWTVRWGPFLQDYYSEAVVDACQNDRRSVEVNFRDLELRDPGLANELLHRPAWVLRIGTQVLNQMDVPVEPRPHLILRIVNLPDAALASVRQLRVEHLGRLVAVEGLVKKVSEHRCILVEACWECKVCTSRVVIMQDEEDLAEPPLCDTCDAKRPFRLLEEQSKYLDHQKIEIQENPEGLRGGAQPERLVVYVQDDLVRKASPGERVRINGILMAKVRRQQQRKTVEYTKVLQCISLEHQEATFLDLELTPEDEEACRQLAANPEVWNLLLQSFARLVKGLDRVKETLLLAAFGGVGHMVDGAWQRGDIHVLIAGDPGIAKSQLLRYLKNLIPNAVLANGKSSSGVGLTVAAVRDDFSNSGWALEAGVLVLAHGGLALIDEGDKISEEDVPYLLDAMGHQSINIAKAGITATLNTRCGVIMACNPEAGRFDPFGGAPATQLGLMLALLSRFDVPWCVRDKFSAEADAKIAQHILLLQDGIIEEDAGLEPPLSEDVMRKYVAYAKRTTNPRLSPAARATLQAFILGVREAAMSSGKDNGHVTWRLASSLQRVSVAHARAHLRNEANVEDATYAVALLKEALVSMGVIDAAGKFDTGILGAGVGLDQFRRMRDLTETIRDLQVTRKWVHEEDILLKLEASGQERAQTVKDLQVLLRSSKAYQPEGKNTWRLL